MGPWRDQGRRFAVAITCIDGRIHQSVTDWARLTFDVVASHTDCAENPVADDQHKQMVRAGVAELVAEFPGLTIVGVHIDGSGRVVPVTAPPARSSLTA